MKANERPLLLVNAQILDPVNEKPVPGSLTIRDGLIKGISESPRPKASADYEVIDCGGRIVAPGLIDMRAFIGEPGAASRETLLTASKAAAAGGITTVISMPETNPVVDTPATVDYILRRAHDTAIVNIRPMAALTKGTLGQEMTEFGLLREAGAVAFTDGSRSVTNAQVMRRALTYAADLGALVCQHVEDPHLVANGVMNEGLLASRLGLVGIPREAETIMLERDIRLVRLTRGRYHAAMISCTDSIDIARKAKENGLPFTCGVSINNLTFNENDIGDYRTFFKLTPPLRDEDDRQAVIAALSEGLIDVIVSDHNPQNVETKRLPFADAANGAIGLQTLLSASLRLVHSGHISLAKLMRALSTRPAEILGLPGGRLRPGAPADIIVFDPDEPYVVDKDKLFSRSKNTPFEDARLQGRVVLTMVAGKIVFDTLHPEQNYVPDEEVEG
ncbi:dihydroorotase [Microvirga sp. W0021]|uniref:Dihydroorotase n=1 Tax=Hohaiivirga grylli TaxID=3133970 RepID=A0ABV0BJS1_9HYPH